MKIGNEVFKRLNNNTTCVCLCVLDMCWICLYTRTKLGSIYNIYTRLKLKEVWHNEAKVNCMEFHINRQSGATRHKCDIEICESVISNRVRRRVYLEMAKRSANALMLGCFNLLLYTVKKGANGSFLKNMGETILFF